MKFLKHGSQKILKFVMVMILAISCNVMGTVCFAEETQGEFIQVSAGESHCVALKADGTVWAWGRGLEGQLGNGKFKNSTIPVKVKGLKNISKVSAGGKHNLALDEEGRVWAWGDRHDSWEAGKQRRPALYRRAVYQKAVYGEDSFTV